MNDFQNKKGIELGITWTSIVFFHKKRISYGLYLDYVMVLVIVMNMQDYT
jgi:hypothetical protein